MDWRAYFIFSKKERTGVGVLVLIMVVLALLPAVWKKPVAPPEIIRADSLENRMTRKSFRNNDYGYRYTDSSRYGGYRGNDEERPGGRNDYGLPGNKTRSPYQRDWRPLYPPYNGYPAYHPYKRYPVDGQNGRYSRDHQQKAGYKNNGRWDTRENILPEPPVIVEINSADTTAFIALPGIGSKLAGRIILFREKLGGFYNVQQMGEVYGLTDSTFTMLKKYLKCDAGAIRKLNINQAGEEVLRQHPYIRWNLAGSLVAYRTAHGPYSSPQDLEKVGNIDSSSLKKILPYLSF